MCVNTGGSAILDVCVLPPFYIIILNVLIISSTRIASYRNVEYKVQKILKQQQAMLHYHYN